MYEEVEDQWYWESWKNPENGRGTKFSTYALGLFTEPPQPTATSRAYYVHQGKYNGKLVEAAQTETYQFVCEVSQFETVGLIQFVPWLLKVNFLVMVHPPRKLVPRPQRTSSL